MKTHGDKNNLCFKDKTWTSSEEPAFTMKPPIKAHRTHCLSFKIFLIVFCWLLLSCDPQRLHLTASEISFVSLYLFLKIHSSGLGMHSKGAGSASTAFSSENENTSLKRMPWISPNKQETGNYEKYWEEGGEKKAFMHLLDLLKSVTMLCKPGFGCLKQPRKISQICENGAGISREDDCLLTFLFPSLAWCKNWDA